MGIYMLCKKVLQVIPYNEAYGFDTLMIDLINSKNNASVKKFEGYWLDIGRPDDYMEAIEEFENKKDTFLKGE